SVVTLPRPRTLWRNRGCWLSLSGPLGGARSPAGRCPGTRMYEFGPAEDFRGADRSGGGRGRTASTHRSPSPTRHPPLSSLGPRVRSLGPYGCAAIAPVTLRRGTGATVS